MPQKEKLTSKQLSKYAKAASAKAIDEARAKGIPFAVQEGKNIVKVFPNGHKEVVGHLDKAFIRVSKKRYAMA